jgi:hypothetical protein
MLKHQVATNLSGASIVNVVAKNDPALRRGVMQRFFCADA